MPRQYVCSTTYNPSMKILSLWMDDFRIIYPVVRVTRKFKLLFLELETFLNPSEQIYFGKDVTHLFFSFMFKLKSSNISSSPKPCTTINVSSLAGNSQSGKSVQCNSFCIGHSYRFYLNRIEHKNTQQSLYHF